MTDALDCFKAYDVRGRIPDQLNEDIARRIGKAYAKVIQPGTVVVGHDIRLTSESIKGALIDGLPPGRLGGEVAELPLNHPLIGAEGLSRGLGEPKVYELHLTLTADEDIRGADVAVDDVERLSVWCGAPVRVIEALADLNGDEDGLLNREPHSAQG